MNKAELTEQQQEILQVAEVGLALSYSVLAAINIVDDVLKGRPPSYKDLADWFTWIGNAKNHFGADIAEPANYDREIFQKMVVWFDETVRMIGGKEPPA